MSEFVLQLSEIMRAEIKGLDAVANNAANISTPGYRSERAVQSGDSFLKRLGAPEVAGKNTALSQRDGGLQTTGAPTDLALRGDGWFLVETPEGARLTRDGRFRLDKDGTLLTQGGYPVLGENGKLTGLPSVFVVTTEGAISHDGAKTGSLQLVRAPDNDALTSVGNGLYRYDGDLERAVQVTVMQGGFETSNVDTAADMLHLMRTTRHIESLQRSISAYDQLLGTGVNQLGKP